MTRTPNDLIAAQNPTPNHDQPADRPRREGVNSVSFLNRNPERKRAWDDMSALDRAVLLESVRQRREAAEQRRAALAGLHAMRSDR